MVLDQEAIDSLNKRMQNTKTSESILLQLYLLPRDLQIAWFCRSAGIYVGVGKTHDEAEAFAMREANTTHAEIKVEFPEHGASSCLPDEMRPAVMMPTDSISEWFELLCEFHRIGAADADGRAFREFEARARLAELLELTP